VFLAWIFNDEFFCFSSFGLNMYITFVYIIHVHIKQKNLVLWVLDIRDVDFGIK